MSRAAQRLARVRRAVPADAAAIHALEDHFPSDRMSLRSVRDFLRSPRAAVWIAARAASAAGALILLTRKDSRGARIYSVVVDPAARGQGLAQRLVRAAEIHARARGLQRVYLEVRVDNHAAQGLYHKLGYVQSARLRGFYEDGADGLRLTKAL